MADFTVRTVQVGPKQKVALEDDERVLRVRVEVTPRGETFHHLTILSPVGGDDTVTGGP